MGERVTVKPGASDEALHDCPEGKVSRNSVRHKLQDLLAIQSTQKQHPNTVCSFIIIFYHLFPLFIRPATGRGHKYVKGKCTTEEVSISQST